jgi:DNA polymerase-3 subunit alpha
MGKKDKKEMAKQREMFISGCKQKGIEESTSIKIFDKMEKFALYGFNKSHAAAYAYLSYVTAYLKANYPREWMAALMTCDSDDLSKVAKFIRECRSMRIPILSPDVNESGIEFVATKDAIRFAMNGIKGLGGAVGEAIIEDRKAFGPYKSFQDFINRSDKKRVSKKNIELLIDAGAFDFTKWSRDSMHIALESLYESALKEQEEKRKGVLTFFSLIDKTPDSSPPEVTNPSSKFDILRKEKELLGFYLTSHPLDYYQTILQKLSAVPLKDIENQKDGSVFRSAFIIESVKVKIASKSQKKFAILNISDGLDRLELPIWPDLYEKKSSLMLENQLIYAILQVENKDGSFKLQCQWLEDLTKINENMIKSCDLVFDQTKEQIKQQINRKSMEEKKAPSDRPTLLTIHIDAGAMRLSKILELKSILLENGGKTPVELHFSSENGKIGAVILDSTYAVACEEKSLKRISEVIGIKRVEVKTA